MIGICRKRNLIWEWFLLLRMELCSPLYSLFSAAAGDSRKKVLPMQEHLRSAQINDQAQKLMSLYGKSVLRLAYSYLHNTSDAEDVLQDALIQYIKAQPHFESPEHEKAWFLRVAMNISKNKINYNKVRKTDDLNEDLVASAAEDLAFLWEAVKQLPMKYREVVHLYYHEGYSTAQIASLLTARESTVRSCLLRARAKLKVVLKEGYDFEE
ncbi:RNA polymerase sigma factor [Paenibacillus sp. P3E]|uniref:RNA polymerase sigma factor n=1 Tax=Paenibacillus sp. P3E TaxID=1349435 RepID=UPI000A52A46A|nr:sigma-70 family RNA polymerase sigma factor [Paenibacillus sp. P3E]